MINFLISPLFKSAHSCCFFPHFLLFPCFYVCFFLNGKLGAIPLSSGPLFWFIKFFIIIPKCVTYFLLIEKLCKSSFCRQKLETSVDEVELHKYSFKQKKKPMMQILYNGLSVFFVVRSIGFLYEFFNKNGHVFAIDKARKLVLHLKESRCNGLELSKLRCMNLQLQRFRVYSFVIIRFKVHGLVVARIRVHGFAILESRCMWLQLSKSRELGEPRVSNVLSLETTPSILSIPFDNKTLNIPQFCCLSLVINDCEECQNIGLFHNPFFHITIAMFKVMCVCVLIEHSFIFINLKSSFVTHNPCGCFKTFLQLKVVPSTTIFNSFTKSLKVFMFTISLDNLLSLI